jgi:anti-sigma regulatory factor (Ser/Thr protein kinase)
MTPAAGQATAQSHAVFSQPVHSQPPSDRLDPRARLGSYACADLALDPATAAQARRLTRDALARWDMRHLTNDAEAIASELAANAINAATPARGTLPAIIFAVHCRPDELRIIVWDNGPGRPHHGAPGPDAETGRGLAIVDSLTARNWGWWPTPHSGGKVVWAALPATAPDAAAPQRIAS